MRTGKWAKEEIETLRVMRCDRGETIPQIAEALGRTRNAVSKQIQRLDLRLPARVTRVIPVADRPETMAKLREAFQEGLTLKEVAQITGLWETTVSEAFYRFSDEIVRANKPPADFGPYIGGKEMVQIAAHACGVPPKCVLGQTRFRPAVLARMAVARALRDRGVSTPVIARAIGRSDHTTVINLLANFPAYSRRYWELNAAYDAIKQAEKAGAEKLAA